MKETEMKKVKGMEMEKQFYLMVILMKVNMKKANDMDMLVVFVFFGSKVKKKKIVSLIIYFNQSLMFGYH